MKSIRITKYDFYKLLSTCFIFWISLIIWFYQLVSMTGFTIYKWSILFKKSLLFNKWSDDCWFL